jgi:DNA-directed RNA polymerase specialized sigma24 family protein
MIRSTPSRAKGLGSALNAEWAQLAANAAESPLDWGSSWPALAACESLDDVLGLVREQPDPALYALLSLSACGDVLAARVVLQAMLGKLVRMAAIDTQAGLDDYVGALWLRIRTYPTADRPVRIAANLALDTLKTVQGQRRTPRGIEVTPYPPSAFVDSLWDRPEPSADELAARRVIRAAARLGLISSDTEAVLTSVYADGLSGPSAAARHGKSPGAIRVQCHTAVRRMAQHARLLADVA